MALVGTFKAYIAGAKMSIKFFYLPNNQICLPSHNEVVLGCVKFWYRMKHTYRTGAKEVSKPDFFFPQEQKCEITTSAKVYYVMLIFPPSSKLDELWRRLWSSFSKATLDCVEVPAVFCGRLFHRLLHTPVKRKSILAIDSSSKIILHCTFEKSAKSFVSNQIFIKLLK